MTLRDFITYSAFGDTLRRQAEVRDAHILKDFLAVGIIVALSLLILSIGG